MKKLLYILLFVPLALFGQDNYSLSFDGDDDYVSINHTDINISSSFSLSIGFKNENSNSIQPWEVLFSDLLFDLGQGICIFIQNSTLKYTTGEAYNEVEITTIPSNIYSYFTCTYFNNLLKFYSGDNLVYSSNVVINPSSLSELVLGNRFANNELQLTNDNFYGLLDNLIIWDYALTQSEIQSYISCPPTENEEGLVGYWNFNEGSGDTVYDISGNGNHGFINGAIYSDDTPEQNCESSDELSIIEQLNTSFDAWNISIDLSAGWNMFGYGCPESYGVADGLSNHTESIIITKDNNGNVYMPEFGFNGIGDFTPGFGYQIKLTEAIEGFSLCDWYVNDIPEDNIVSLQEENASLQEEVDFMSPYFGCMDSTACNYDETILLSDGSCEFPQQGYDCYGNEILYQVGDYIEGGIVFYVGETGQHGLVAALEDIIDGATLQAYQWGCFNEEVDGADGQAIGTGYQNTLDIVTQNCQTENGGITAAQAALDAEINAYSDWYLPSLNELQEIYNTIGNGGPQGNIGDMENTTYWSSSENGSNYVWTVIFHNGQTSYYWKFNTGKVRVIRAFGNWIEGCTDESACNYNHQANMLDGSCEYPEEGYDCDGNVYPYSIGQEAFGGIIFYIDETGEHGLVAAMEDIEGTYEWGCYEIELSGADGTSIGTGHQNTIDIATGCSESPIAASEALAYEAEGYSDWYLPSKDELYQIYLTIGQGSTVGNIGGFEYIRYWSSSENTNSLTWVVHFNDGDMLNHLKNYSTKVRVIRSF